MDAPSSQQNRHLHIHELTRKTYNESTELYDANSKEIIRDGCDTGLVFLANQLDGKLNN